MKELRHRPPNSACSIPHILLPCHAREIIILVTGVCNHCTDRLAPQEGLSVMLTGLGTSNSLEPEIYGVFDGLDREI